MKKILFLIQLPPPIHGAAIMNARVLNSLDSDCLVETRVIRLSYARNFEEMHAGVFIKGMYSLGVIWRYFFNLILFRPEWVYISFPPFGLGFYRDFFFLLVAECFGVGVKLHLHGAGLSSVNSKLKRRMLRHMFSAGGLILLSKSLYSDVSSYISEEKVSVIPNAVDTPDYEFSDHKFKFMYMANLDERKGVLKVLEIFREVKKRNVEATLQIVGADTVYMSRDRLEAMLLQEYSDIKNSVVLHGALYGEYKNSVFEESDIFIYPTAHDAAPLVVLEAQSYGLPVVCSNQGALPDMVSDGITGFVANDYSPDFYADCVDQILNEYKNYSLASRNRHLTVYSLRAMRARLKEAFCV